uniref:Uncharacterized protein n=1 Tax=Parascaris equorum TaxID=6256 RepID=A0A914RZ76_PAREQ
MCGSLLQLGDVCELGATAAATHCEYIELHRQRAGNRCTKAEWYSRS